MTKAAFISFTQNEFVKLTAALLWEESGIIERTPYPSALWEVTTEERMTNTEKNNSLSCSSVAMVTFRACVK